MKKSLLILTVGLLLSSCIAVKFPSEIKVHIDVPDNISEEQVDRLIDKIPPILGQRKVKTLVEISSEKGTTVKEEKTEENYNKNN